MFYTLYSSNRHKQAYTTRIRLQFDLKRVNSCIKYRNYIINNKPFDIFEAPCTGYLLVELALIVIVFFSYQIIIASFNT